MRDIIVSNILKVISYKELLKNTKKHFSPHPCEIGERFKFQQGKAIADLVKNLRQLSKFWNFDNTLNDRLHDQLGFVIQHEKIQQKLLDTKNLTFQTSCGNSLIF